MKLDTGSDKKALKRAFFYCNTFGPG